MKFKRAKIAVVGCGASGLTCASTLVRSKAAFELVLFEKNDRAGKKLLSTGNGRCNFSNSFNREYVSVGSGIEAQVNSNSADRTFFASMGVPGYSDSEGRWYPLSNRASSISDALLACLSDERVNFKPGTEINSAVAKSNGIELNGELFDIVVLACGGKARVNSFNAFDLSAQLGHSVTPTAPALVKLKCSSPFLKGLSGVRAAARVILMSNGKELLSEIGELQLAPGSISGICAMQLSLVASKLFLKGQKCKIIVDFLPSLSVEEAAGYIKNAQNHVPFVSSLHLLCGLMHRLLALQLFKETGIDPNISGQKMTENQIKKLCEAAKSVSLPIDGTFGYNDAQVMLGGVKLRELDVSTGLSKINGNLYVIGETVDITGFCGGYNLSHAWFSGIAAAEDILNRI